MFVKIFDNYHAGVACLTREEQDAFYGSVMRYAFEGEEPQLSGGAMCVWLTIKDFIDTSLKGQENGAKGGDGRGNKKRSDDSAKDPSKTQSENPSGKPPAKRPPENQKNRKERNSRENLKGFSTNSDASGDAGAGAPPAAIQCPTCDAPMERTNLRKAGTDRHIWRCPLCHEEVSE